MVSNVLDTKTLTESQRRVLELYQAGHSVRQIAEQLGVSTQRVYQQLNKLNLRPPVKGWAS